MDIPKFIADVLGKALGVEDPAQIIGRKFFFTYEDITGQPIAFGGMITSFDLLSEQGNVTLEITTHRTEGIVIKHLDYNPRDPQSRGWRAQSDLFGDIYGELTLI